MVEKKKSTLLAVDDEQHIVDSLYDTFMDKYNVLTALSGAEALDIFNKADIALVITDQRMPGMTGSELLARINKLKPVCQKILLTGYADINAAIDAINNGAVNKYIAKPWDDDELLQTVDHLITKYNVLAELVQQNQELRDLLISI